MKRKRQKGGGSFGSPWKDCELTEVLSMSLTNEEYRDIDDGANTSTVERGNNNPTRTRLGTGGEGKGGGEKRVVSTVLTRKF